MPYQNEHAAEQAPVSKCDKFRRENDKFGPGVDVIWCVRGGKADVQSIRFDAEKFTPDEARAWLKKHDCSADKFEPASGKAKAEAKAEAVSDIAAYSPDQSRDPDGKFAAAESAAKEAEKAAAETKGWSKEVRDSSAKAFAASKKAAKTGSAEDHKAAAEAHHEAAKVHRAQRLPDSSQSPVARDFQRAGDAHHNAAAAHYAAAGSAAVRHGARAQGGSQPSSDSLELAAADLEIKAAYDRGLITTASEAVELLAAREDGGRKLRGFAMTAYTGAAMKLPNFMRPVVIDLSGMKIPTQSVPIFRSHDPERIVGHSEKIELSAQRMRVGGIMSGIGAAAQEVLQLAENRFPWQASVGADVQAGGMEAIEAGASAKANGRNFDGPLLVARKTVLHEISFVPAGADPNTSATVAQ